MSNVEDKLDELITQARNTSANIDLMRGELTVIRDTLTAHESRIAFLEAGKMRAPMLSLPSEVAHRVGDSLAPAMSAMTAVQRHTVMSQIVTGVIVGLGILAYLLGGKK